MKIVFFVIALALLVGGIFYVVDFGKDEVSPKSAEVKKEQEAADQVQEQAFIADINRIIATNSAKIAVEVVDLKPDKKYQFAANDPFVAASTMKTLVGTYAVSKIQQGELKKEQPLGNYNVITQVGFMLKNSSNPAWELLNNLLGLTRIESFGKTLGMTQVNTDKNLISAHDLSILLSKLYKGEILDDKHKELLFSFMHETETENRIPVGLPKGTKIFHKTGTFGDVVHDAAIVDDGKRPFVLVVLTSGIAPEGFKIAKIVEVSKRTWQFQNR